MVRSPQATFYVLEALGQHATEESEAGSSSARHGRRPLRQRTFGKRRPKKARITGSGAGTRSTAGSNIPRALSSPTGSPSPRSIPRPHDHVVRSRATDGVRIIDDWDRFRAARTGSGTVSSKTFTWIRFCVPHHRGFEPTEYDRFRRRDHHAGVDLGIARGSVRETLDLVRKRGSNQKRCAGAASEDALTIARVGEVAIRIEPPPRSSSNAGRKVRYRAGRSDRGTRGRSQPLVTAAKVLAAAAALEAAMRFFDLAGSPLRSLRSISTAIGATPAAHTLQDPVR
ncbi:hypothetical protein F2981_23040 (plasmid) [Sinorhizobium meliloti]|nr:hypothetical protein [Sinorhizobium meliloti]